MIKRRLRLTAALLSAILVMTAIPVMADEPAGVNLSEMTDAGEPDTGEMTDAGEPDAADMTDAGEPEAADMTDAGEPDTAEMTDAGEPEAADPADDTISETVNEAADEDDGRWEVTFSPKVNTTCTTMELAGAETLLGSGEADRVRVDAVMTYNGQTTRSVTKTVSLSETGENGKTEIDLGDYGKWTVTVTFLKGETEVRKTADLTAGIVADVYNIAPVSATLPVTFFSLNLWGDAGIRQNGPTILMMERPGAYDWNALPDGVYAIPYMTKEDVSYQSPSFDGASERFKGNEVIMADYVKDLMALNPSSFIHLYCVDVYTQLIPKIIYANRIPETQYDITLMSDGSFTYAQFSSVYGDADPAAKHSQLVSEWQEAKANTYENGELDPALTHGFCKTCFWAAVDSEPNARMWVTRKDLFVSPEDDNTFGKSVQGSAKLVQVNIGNLLKTNIQASEENTAQFKALYNFNDSFFEKAASEGKDAMVFLGTRVTAEPAFEAYARFVMTYYGDQYVYYYKGHPGTPTDLYPTKIDQLDRLGIIDIDSSIAAELILFFNPEIYLSGYQSSTYASVPVGMGKGMFNMTKEKGLSDPQYENMAFWMSPVTDDSDERVRELVTEGAESYLVEFNDSVSAEKGYDIAVWELAAPLIRYYKENEGAYELVGQEGGERSHAVVPGTYIIGSAADLAKVLDVAGGSKAPRANVQLYSYNDTDAQKWEVSYDEEGLATITNVGSGLVLDAAGGKTDKRTNIWQYRDNGSAAQKWVLKRNDDGTVVITSAKSDQAVIDLSGGKPVKKANIQLYKPNGSDAQRWYFFEADPQVSAEGQADLEEGWYTITSDLDRNLRLQVAGSSPAEKGNLQVGTASDAENQLFYLARTEDGFYRITSSLSGLNATLDKGWLIPGVNIYQSSAEDKTAEWAITQKSGGACLIRNAASGTMMEVSLGHREDGANVNGGIANGAQGQAWLIRRAPSTKEHLDQLAAANAEALPDGIYTIYGGKDGDMVLDVKGGSDDNKANVQLYRRNRTLAQLWSVTHDDRGYVTLTNAGSGKVLDVAGGKKARGSNIWQYRSNGSDAQKWVAIPDEDGRFRLVSALSDNLVIDIKGGKLTKGANVQLYRDNGTEAQRFRIVRLGAAS